MKKETVYIFNSCFQIAMFIFKVISTMIGNKGYNVPVKKKFAHDRKDSLRINGKISRSRRAVYFVA